jgi:hypothetical protein
VRSTAGDAILRRLEQGAIILGDDSAWQPSPASDVGRWRIDYRWIEFECGCRAERCMQLTFPVASDPIIFRDLPEQAVYDYCCHFHMPAMNKYVGAGGRYKTFDQWKIGRRPLLTRN